MKNLFLWLFSFITEREVKATKSFEELLAVAIKLCRYRGYGFVKDRMDKKYREYLVRQAETSILHAKEVEEISKILKYDKYTADLIGDFIKRRTIYAEDLPYLLCFNSRSYPRELLGQLTKIIKDLVSRVGHEDMLIIAKVFIGLGSNYDNFRSDLFGPDSIEKMTAKLTSSVKFMNSDEIEKCLEIVSHHCTPSDIKRKLSRALAKNKRISSLNDAIEILSNLWSDDKEERNAVMNEVTILAEKEINSLNHFIGMIEWLADKKNKKDCRGLKNILITRAISLASESEPLSLGDMAFLISHAEWPDNILLKNILGAILKIARLQKMTANDAVILASEFSSEDTRYIFLCLYVEEIWEPNFNEALILWGSYKDEKNFPKDNMDAVIFSALQKSEVELGTEELIRTQVWGIGRGDSKRIPQVMLDKVEAFIRINNKNKYC